MFVWEEILAPTIRAEQNLELSMGELLDLMSFLTPCRAYKQPMPLLHPPFRRSLHVLILQLPQARSLLPITLTSNLSNPMLLSLP